MKHASLIKPKKTLKPVISKLEETEDIIFQLDQQIGYMKAKLAELKETDLTVNTINQLIEAINIVSSKLDGLTESLQETSPLEEMEREALTKLLEVLK
jgi:hypothetical protein